MIDNVREYIAKCPFLNEYKLLNVEYLISDIEAYSINENAGYDPVESEDIIGNQTKQFLFTFDGRG